MNNLSPLEAIFFAALENASPSERAAYLDEACAGDAELRQRVEKMLSAQADAGSFLESPAAGIAATAAMPPLTEAPGTVIGPYKLLEQIAGILAPNCRSQLDLRGPGCTANWPQVTRDRLANHSAGRIPAFFRGGFGAASSH